MSRHSGQALTLLSATVTTGLTAGLFGDWAHTIMPGLVTTDDRVFVAAVQALDRAIYNPLFLLPFLGGLVFSGLAVLLHLRAPERPVLPWVAAAFGLHLAAWAITAAVHLPLNAAIAAPGDPAVLRHAFDEGLWAAWHAVRTTAALVAFGCLAWALVLHGRSTAVPGVPPNAAHPSTRARST